MNDVLTLPENGLVGAAGRPPRGVPDILDVLTDVVSGAGVRALSADPTEAAAFRLVVQHGSDAAAAAGWLADHVEGAGFDLPWNRLLYDGASAAVAAARFGEAIVLLVALTEVPAGRGDALIGLAVCAARLSAYEEALALALESRGLRPDHPRASCIAGLAELERGNRRAAQSHLAAAARLARGRPEFQEDLRLAQRNLLLMQIG